MGKSLYIKVRRWPGCLSPGCINPELWDFAATPEQSIQEQREAQHCVYIASKPYTLCLHHPELFSRDLWAAWAVVGSLWGLLWGISPQGLTGARNIHMTPQKRFKLKYWFSWSCHLVAFKLYFLSTFFGNCNVCCCLQFCLETRACFSFSNAVAVYVNLAL